MPFQFLYDFFCLQIPNIDVVILASTDNPFSTRHTVTCKNTILVVLMPPIGFETLSGMIIPQPQRIVERRRKDILAIGREFDKRSRRKYIRSLSNRRRDFTYTGGLSSSTKVFRHCPLAVSQIRLINHASICSSFKSK